MGSKGLPSSQVNVGMMLDPQNIQKGDFVSLKLESGAKLEGTVNWADKTGFSILPFYFVISLVYNTVHYFGTYDEHRVTITSIGRSHPAPMKEEV
jgi:hypothetical protein